MTATKIEWTRGDDGTPGVVWNPTTGCDRTSPGCDNCYALTLAKRLKGMGAAKYQRDGAPETSGPGFGITEHADALTVPLSWRKPRRVFVNSMSDLFHKGVSDEFIAQVFAVMAATPQHTYQILTKRHGRMRSLLSSHRFWLAVVSRSGVSVPTANAHCLPHVWLGVSVEDQQRADLRIPALLDTPAAVRFLSCEPLLAPVSLANWTKVWPTTAVGGRGVGGATITATIPGLHWVIVGGESGPGARRMEFDWVRDILADCQSGGVATFVKQLGSAYGPHKGGDIDTWPADLRVREFPQEVQA